MGKDKKRMKANPIKEQHHFPIFVFQKQFAFLIAHPHTSIAQRNIQEYTA